MTQNTILTTIPTILTILIILTMLTIPTLYAQKNTTLQISASQE